MPLDKLAQLFSPLALLNGFAAGTPVESAAYGTHERQQLDLYRPRRSRAGPVAVFFYGGGWEEGERQDYRFVGAALAAAGILTVIPDYRLFPEVRFPGFLEDAAAAVRWTRDHVAGLGGDPGRLVLIGHSAGAHIAGMLALDRRWLSSAGVESGTVRGWVGIAGPYDFEPDTPSRRIIFGTDRQETQPIGFPRSDAPPALLVAPRHDRVVDPGNSTRLARRIAAAGGDASVKFYRHVDHASIIGSFSPLLRFLAPAFADTRAFVERVTAGATARQGEIA